MQSELNEIERDLTLRRMLWESQEEWHELIFDWTHTPFVEIVVESMQKHVNKFNQTIFMLEKGSYYLKRVTFLKCGHVKLLAIFNLFSRETKRESKDL